GWFDRLLAAPVPRWAILAGMVSSAALRSLIPATALLVVGFSIGVHWPGLGGLLLALILVMGMGVVAACWGTMLALRYRSQSAAASGGRTEWPARALGGGRRAELVRGRARRSPLLVHQPEPGSVSLAVVRGLVLRGDLLAAPRGRPPPARARDADPGGARRRV